MSSVKSVAAHQYYWGRIILLLVFLILLSVLSPDQTLDPWGILNFRKFFQLISALLLIQILSVALIKWLGSRHGLILSGFLGGIISSTALTASLAHARPSTPHRAPAQMLLFLSSTLSMLSLAFLFALLGVENLHWQVSILFAGPIIFTMISIAFLLRRHQKFQIDLELNNGLDFLATIKLVFFIMGILAASKVAENLLGDAGLQVLTFLISLFEIHGSVISSTQLFAAGDLNLSAFGILLVISLGASYISKLFLILFGENKYLKKNVSLFVFAILLVLLLSLVTFLALID